MNSNNKIVYVLSVEAKHGDCADMEENGTTIIGVYDDFDLAIHCLENEYDNDKASLLDGTCRADGPCEITEDYPVEITRLDGVITGAYAQIVTSERADGSFDREYTYNIVPKTLNEEA